MDTHKFRLTQQADSFIKATLLGTNPIKSVALEGPAGCGKTSLAEHVHAHLKMKPGQFFRYVCSKTTTINDLLLDRTAKDGSVIEIMQKFLKVYTEGGVILVDEWRLAPADVIATMVGMFDHAQRWESPDGRVFNRHKDCYVIFASNPVTYAGVKRQHEGFFDRLPTLNLGYSEHEYDIVTEAFPECDKELVAKLVEFAKHVRAGAATKGLTTIVSTRGLLTIMEMVGNGTQVLEAIQFTLKIAPEEQAVIGDLIKLVFNCKPTQDGDGKFILDLVKSSRDEVAKHKKAAENANATKDAVQKRYDDMIKKLQEAAA